MLRIIRLRWAWVFILGGGGLLFSGDLTGLAVGLGMLALGVWLLFRK